MMKTEELYFYGRSFSVTLLTLVNLWYSIKSRRCM